MPFSNSSHSSMAEGSASRSSATSSSGGRSSSGGASTPSASRPGISRGETGAGRVLGRASSSGAKLISCGFRYMSTMVPRAMRSPSCRYSSTMRRLLTKVPFLLSRSRMAIPPHRLMILAWRLDITYSLIGKSHSGSRPMTSSLTSSVRKTFLPSKAPFSTSRLGTISLSKAVSTFLRSFTSSMSLSVTSSSYASPRASSSVWNLMSNRSMDMRSPVRSRFFSWGASLTPFR